MAPQSKKNENGSIVVLKIGTSSIITREELPGGNINGEVKNVTRLNLKQMADVVEVVHRLKHMGHKVILVNSGAVGAGCHLLGLSRRPTDLSQCQALAACGQAHLMGKYEIMFNALNLRCAQVLITYTTFRSKEQYMNATNTFRALLDMGVTPIVNENDTVATKELKSDNDSMAAMVSNLVGAKHLVLLTDVHGVYTGNPNSNPDSKLIRRIHDIEKIKKKIRTDGNSSSWGTGGMLAKLNAAKLATSMGIETIIMKASNVSAVVDYMKTAADTSLLGTIVESARYEVSSRRRWLRCLRPGGKIVIDDHGVNDLVKKEVVRESAIVDCHGKFSSSEPIAVVTEQGEEIARGLTNYSSDEIRKISESQGKNAKSYQTEIVIDQANLIPYPRPIFVTQN